MCVWMGGTNEASTYCGIDTNWTEFRVEFLLRFLLCALNTRYDERNSGNRFFHT